MSRARALHLLAIAGYAFFAAIVAAVLPADALQRALAGMVVFLLAALAHEFLARREDHRWFARELSRLRSAHKDAADKAQRTSDSLAELQASIGYAGSGDGAPDLIGEMRTIRGLLKKLTDRSVAARERAEGALARGVAAEAVHEKLSDAEVLDILQVAFTNDRVDLYLQPIVTLPQRKVLYYEAYGRIRTDAGQVLLPEQYNPVAAREGLLPTIDNLMLFRCVQSVRRAWKEKLDVGFFCNLSREALLEADFFPQFIEFLGRNKELAESLVFEMSQDDADDIRLTDALAQVRRLGFSFSLDNVVRASGDDADDRARRGFRHIKIEAATLLAQPTHLRAGIHVADWSERMKRAGVELIATKVEEESQVLALMELNVTLAQGFLLGEPRPLREAV